MTIEAVVLAAGFSSRAHRYKMTLEFNNSTVIETCIANLYSSVDKIIVIGGYNYHIIKELLSKYEKVQVVYNDNYECGMFSSVKLGINNTTSHKFFLIPGDYVLVDEGVYKQLLDSKSNSSVVIPTFRGRKGHPVLFRENDIKNLINGEFNNLREVINYMGFDTLEVDHDGILYDIDTYEDYIIALEKHLVKEKSKKK